MMEISSLHCKSGKTSVFFTIKFSKSPSPTSNKNKSRKVFISAQASMQLHQQAALSSVQLSRSLFFNIFTSSCCKHGLEFLFSLV